MKPLAYLDSDGFPWSVEGVKWRSTPDTYKALYAKPFLKPLANEVIGQLTTHSRWSGVSSPFLLEFARAIEALHGIKEIKEGCLFCEESICDACWPLPRHK
jgi:hypothetical protein